MSRLANNNFGSITIRTTKRFIHLNRDQVAVLKEKIKLYAHGSINIQDVFNNLPDPPFPSGKIATMKDNNIKREIIKAILKNGHKIL